MADRYLVQGLYTYAATPTWGVAQDGDGTSSGTATPATASVVFTGVPSSGSIAVLGVTLSPTWATNADTCANNLATAINASSTTAVSPAGITVKSQVRNHLFARGPATGAPAGTCEIMMRQGTAAVNGQVAVTHTLNNVSSAGTINFAGGAGGAWGYRYNYAAIWPSAIAIGGYGFDGATLPFCGAIDPGDRVFAAANGEFTFTTGLTTTGAAIGTASRPVLFIVDDGTIWPANGANGRLTFAISTTGNNTWGMSSAAGRWESISGSKRNADGFSNLCFKATGSGTSNPQLRIIPGGGIRFDEIWFRSEGDGFISGGAATSAELAWPTYYDCVFDNNKQNASFGIVHNHNNGTMRGRMTGCTIRLRAPTDVQTVVTGFSGNASGQRWIFDNCKFDGFVTGSRITTTPAYSSVPTFIAFRDCDLGEITVRGPFYGLNGAINGGGELGVWGVTLANSSGKYDFATDTGAGFVEWNSQRLQPTLAATLDDAAETPFSIRIVPTQLSSQISSAASFEGPKHAVTNSFGTDGARTLVFQLAIEQSLSWDRSSISFDVEYQMPDGTRRTESTYSPIGAALDVSTVTWSQESGGQVTFIDSGLKLFNKRSISITTSSPVKAGSLITFRARVHVGVTNVTQSVFYCPAPVVT